MTKLAAIKHKTQYIILKCYESSPINMLDRPIHQQSLALAILALPLQYLILTLALKVIASKTSVPYRSNI